MKLSFKIHNFSIIDCSSCHNAIYPDPESSNLLLKVLLGVCESHVVSRIGQFQFWLNNIEFQSPKIIGYDSFQSKKEGEVYSLRMSKSDDDNKISGLYVESKETALKRITEPSYAGKYSQFKCDKAYYIEPGLEGIRNGFNFIKYLLEDKRDNLPSYLQGLRLKIFGFTAGVIWSIDNKWIKLKENKYPYIDYERSVLDGSCTLSGCKFNFRNTDSGDPYLMQQDYYLNHLNSITEILDDIAYGKYIAGPYDLPKLLEHRVIEKKERELVAVKDKDTFYDRWENYDIEKFVKGLSKHSFEHFKKMYLLGEEPIPVHSTETYENKLKVELQKRVNKLEESKLKNKIKKSI